MAKLEIACFNQTSALLAMQNGADRIELCDDFSSGGITPTIETFVDLREKGTLPIYVMIRPRGGNFIYDEGEFEMMKASIIGLKKLKADGFVFGILNQDKTINIEQNKFLVALAHPVPCTFHRAFDEVDDAFDALERIIACGFTTILTSGQAKNVTNGMQRLRELVFKASDRITIMPGGGLRSSNLAEIQEFTKASYFHSSAIIDGKLIADPAEIMALKSKLK